MNAKPQSPDGIAECQHHLLCIRGQEQETAYWAYRGVERGATVPPPMGRDVGHGRTSRDEGLDGVGCKVGVGGPYRTCFPVVCRTHLTFAW